MIRIGLISDTHGHLDPKIFDHFRNCDEIWHAGDIGTMEVAQQLSKFKPLKAVFGNIDGNDIRVVYPLDLRFNIEEFDIWITHIGGYPGRYSKRVQEGLVSKAPDIFICGHSHILKVMRDRQFNNMLTINPGAAGVHGIHKVKTIMKLELNNRKIEKLEVIELGKRGALK